MELKGKINISRMQKSNNDQYIELSLEDDAAGVTFVKAVLTLEDFAKALTGQGYIDTIITPRGLDLVGTIRQTKTEFVPGVTNWDVRQNSDILKEMVAPFEVDGWKARMSDLTNYHHSQVVNGVKGHNTVFTRNVKACDV